MRKRLGKELSKVPSKGLCSGPPGILDPVAARLADGGSRIATELQTAVTLRAGPNPDPLGVEAVGLGSRLFGTSSQRLADGFR